MQDVKRGPI